jgi:hypothetical protein
LACWLLLLFFSARPALGLLVQLCLLFCPYKHGWHRMGAWCRVVVLHCFWVVGMSLINKHCRLLLLSTLTILCCSTCRAKPCLCYVQSHSVAVRRLYISVDHWQQGHLRSRVT